MFLLKLSWFQLFLPQPAAAQTATAKTGEPHSNKRESLRFSHDHLIWSECSLILGLESELIRFGRSKVTVTETTPGLPLDSPLYYYRLAIVCLKEAYNHQTVVLVFIYFLFILPLKSTKLKSIKP